MRYFHTVFVNQTYVLDSLSLTLTVCVATVVTKLLALL